MDKSTTTKYLNYIDPFNNAYSNDSAKLDIKHNGWLQVTSGSKADVYGQLIVTTFRAGENFYRIEETFKLYSGFGYYSAFINQNGVTIFPGSAEYLTSYTVSKNDVVTTQWSNMYLLATNYSLYEAPEIFPIQFKWDDYIHGTGKNDVIWGYGGNDTLIGDSGNDIIFGGDGNDTLIGGAGDDHLNGGWGQNKIYGGTGLDTIHFSQKKTDFLLSKNPQNKYTYIYSRHGEELGFFDDDVEFFTFSDSNLSESHLLDFAGNPSLIREYAERPVHRFYNNDNKGFYYTSSLEEKTLLQTISQNTLPNGLTLFYQGATFGEATFYSGSNTFVKSFYNSKTDHHFFTASESEARLINSEIILGKSPLEPTTKTFYVYITDPTPGFQGKEVPVHRFYNPLSGRHFFTGNSEEKVLIELTGVWNYEGIAFYGDAV
ncbi:MAG: hypothetical protein P8K11_10565 [Gammaproteobacteria bacterium]|nr:hypothetical protein [Gammaproteobacteria bacterium]